MSEDRLDAKLLTRLAETYSTPDDEAWAVYGDLLQGSGDPRGEIIALERHAHCCSTVLVEKVWGW